MRTYPAPAPSTAPTARATASEGGLAELLGDCARMAPHWAVPAGPAPVRVAPERIHGVTVPAASARLIAGTAVCGD
ncbi:hypothetical protein [Streptomyces sp. NPDC097619]|uniref:hypothetical protein n=1 Tax=Streptomyces sp. NPDC097619 TaxID=3157228 RepID=UPI0033267149